MTDQGLVHSQRNTFGKLFEKLMHNKDITDGTCRLFGHMHWRYGSNKDNHEGRKSMGDMLGVTEATINNRTEALEAHDWVITILRGRNEKNGNWQSAFYHVFEDQKECRKFREEYTPVDGEYMRPKPIEVRKRKSRKGIGGNPQFTNPTQVEPDNPSNSSLDGGSNSSSTRAANLSLDNLDAVDPDSSDLEKDISADAVVSSKAKTPKEPKPKTPKAKDVVFDVVALYAYGLHDTTHIDNGSVIGSIRGMAIRKFKAIIGEPQADIVADSIRQFAANQGGKIPKFASVFQVGYVIWLQKNIDTYRNRLNGQRTVTPPAAPDEPTIELTDEQKEANRIAIAAALEATRQALNGNRNGQHAQREREQAHDAT